MISVAAIVFIMGLNLVTVKLFGELEFWFALIKIIAIVVLIAVGLWMIFGVSLQRRVKLHHLVIFGHMAECSQQA